MPLELGVWRIDGNTVEITPSGMSDEKGVSGSCIPALDLVDSV